jgi:hypothetical protein
VSARVSTLLNLEPAGGRYVFLLVEWNDYADRVRDELNRQADAFGLDLGPAGVFVEAYPQRSGPAQSSTSWKLTAIGLSSVLAMCRRQYAWSL